MGLGSYFPCCSCQNLKKSIWFDCEENNKNNNQNNNIIINTNKQFENNNNINANNKSINDNRTNEERIIIHQEIKTSKFNKNGSLIVNPNLLQTSELKLDIQPQQTDEFDQMFNQLSDISGNNN